MILTSITAVHAEKISKHCFSRKTPICLAKMSQNRLKSAHSIDPCRVDCLRNTQSTKWSLLDPPIGVDPKTRTSEEVCTFVLIILKSGK
jgi:hypothetical protein